MAKNPNISIGFSSNKFAQEVNSMVAPLKNVKKEFEKTNLAIEATGDKFALAANKLKGYEAETKILKAATSAMKKGLDDAVNTQSKLTAKVEAAKQAYQNAANAEIKSTEEVKKLKQQYDDLVSRLSKADKAVANWKNKILDSQIAENKLKVAVSQTCAEIDKLNNQQARNIKSTQNVTTASGQLLNIYTLIKGLAIGYAGKTLYEALIGDNAKFEQNMTAFEVLLGGAEKAQKEMERLTQFAAVTPFTLPQTVDTEKRLLAYGVDIKNVAGVMQMLGDISMGIPEKLDMISLAYGQVVTNQKLYGTELRQFAENGVPLLDALAKMYGKTTAEMRKMIENGQISADAVTAALQGMTAEGGKFHGMMDKQSKTMSGMWSTLKDDISMFARDVGSEGFEYLKGELSSLLDTINEMSANGQLDKMAEDWGRNIATFIEYVAKAVEILWEMKDVLIAVGAAMAITSVINAAAGAFNVLKSTVLAVKAGFDAAKVSNDVLNASLIKSPWGLVAAAIGIVGGALVTYALTASKAESEADKLAKKTADLKSEYESNIQSIDRQTKSSMGEIAMSQRLAKELEGLSGKTNKTTTEKNRMGQIVDQLNQKIPNLALALNSETGELNKQIGVVYNAIDAYKQLLFVKAADKKASAAAENILNMQDQKTAIEKSIKNNQNALNEANKKISSSMTDVFGKSTLESVTKSFKNESKINGILIERKNLQSQLDNVNKSIADSEKAISDSQKMAQDYAKKYGNNNPNTNNNNNKEPPPLLNGKNNDKDAERARKEAIQREFETLKFNLDMGYITEATYYKKLAVLRDKYYKSGSSEWQQYTLEIKQYNDKAKENALQAQKEEYQERLKNSEQWISAQKNYGKLSAEQEVASYEKIRAYTKEYYNKKVINYKDYLEQLKSLDQTEFNIRKQALQDEISSEVDAQKKILDSRKEAIEKEADYDKKKYDARKKQIEAEYDLIEQNEKKADRNTELADLARQEQIFRAAVTTEGKNRLKEIHDKIADLNKEAAKEQRDVEKKGKLDALEEHQTQTEEARKARLDAISDEYTRLDEKQKDLLKNIGDYAASAAGKIEEATAKVKALIDAVTHINPSSTLTGQQVPTVRKTVINQTNNNNIYDSVSANVFGSMLTSGLRGMAT
ncbi:tape measure protein [Clostridium sp. BNL1100]|uniref:tape measure protein n=1 Tax=Clostridium sp. BNL1100 TaxID=755731 RepID=UPI00024A7F18|nr:tape measure protein [Clostridium sp. BNL1100]AEY65425.1 tape measure domain protein [Clostridium sp. BNL1100]